MSAGGKPFHHKGVQPCPGGIEGGGVASGAAADDDGVVNMFHEINSFTFFLFILYPIFLANTVTESQK